MSSTSRTARADEPRQGARGKAADAQLDFLQATAGRSARLTTPAKAKANGNGAAPARAKRNGEVPAGTGSSVPEPALLPIEVPLEAVVDDKPRRGRPPKNGKRQTAQDMAAKQREISVSEFFTKNRHLLGFDNLHKALLTTVREAVDNALDACEEAGIMPQIAVAIREVSEDRYVVTVEDNGPGIVKAQLPKIFGKLLYGSKFHRLKQSRGQQGIGISAAAMYGQITTGRPITIVSKTGPGRDVHKLEQQIDTIKNQPVVLSEILLNDDPAWQHKDSGTLVQIELQASFKGGQHSIESYLRQTALANPHAEIAYVPPKGPPLRFARVVSQPPEEAQEIKPHPHGVELGILMRMLKEARGLSVRQFLVQSFSRVSDKVAGEILETAALPPRATTAEVHRQHVEALYQAIQNTKIMAPPTSCLSPIGADAIQRGMLALLHADQNGVDEVGEEVVDQIVQAAEVDPDSGIETAGMFVTAVTRPPAVYRGNPFQIEVGIAYGKALPADQLARVYRFANRVPLLYQGSACAMTKAVMQTAWRNYDIQQSRGALPTAPMLIMVHIASAWVPYTSESKEAIAHYPEILRELKLALQEAGRRLAIHVRRRRREADEDKKQRYIHKYIDPIGEALQEILHLSPAQTQVAVETIREILEKSRKL